MATERTRASATWGWRLFLAVLTVTVVGCGSSEGTTAYTITVYFTAVESFHSGPPREVRGSLTPQDAPGDVVLGSWPSDFVDALTMTGSGRITTGPSAGHYLNWSYDIGYWLDVVPANAYGGALLPFHTAAADLDVLPRGTRFHLMAPLANEDGTPLDNDSASRFLDASWEVDDQFTPGLGGANHLDLYLGEEDRVDFTDTSPLYVTLLNVGVREE